MKPNALDIVHQTLRDLREQGVELRASAQALRRLAQTQGAAAQNEAAPPPSAPAVAPEGSNKGSAGVIRETAPHAAPLPAAVAKPLPEPVAPALDVAQPVADLPQLVVRPVRAARPAGYSAGSNAERLAALAEVARACVKCPQLAAARKQVVFGAGNPEAELMFIGEAPGDEEDAAGEPFVGPAGDMLTKIIVAMGLKREEVYIANVLKCRPCVLGDEANTRKPHKDELHNCVGYLKQQIEIIQPRLLVALGAVAMDGLLGKKEPMAKLRGRWHDFEGIEMMATYHPAYLLRNQALGEKRKVWEDMLQVLERLGRPISDKQRGFFLPKA